MAKAANHYKQMKNLMTSKVDVAIFKSRQLQRIDDTACSVNKTAGEKP